MADLEFDVAVRRSEPITFKLNKGSPTALLEPGVESENEGESRAEVRGLDDHEYVFNPPKTAVMIMPLMNGGDASGLSLTRATFDWLGEGLSKEDNARLLARLRDVKDDLDTSTVEKVIEKLTERVAGRPTT